MQNPVWPRRRPASRCLVKKGLLAALIFRHARASPPREAVQVDIPLDNLGGCALTWQPKTLGSVTVINILAHSLIVDADGLTVALRCVPSQTLF